MSDGELLRAAASGCRPSFRRLLERHRGPVLALARRLTGNPRDAEEVAQEAFLRVWLAAPSWNQDGPARFATWLYRVVTNLCVDRLRRSSGAMQVLDETIPAEQPDGFDRVAGEDGRTLVVDAVAALAPRQRSAVELCYFRGMTTGQAACHLGLSQAALESLLARGRRSLRKRLAGRGIMRIDDIL